MRTTTLLLIVLATCGALACVLVATSDEAPQSTLVQDVLRPTGDVPGRLLGGLAEERPSSLAAQTAMAGEPAGVQSAPSRPSRPRALRGRVVDGGGEGVQGVRVSARRARGSTPGGGASLAEVLSTGTAPAVTTTTDDLGAFALEVERGNWWIAARRAGFATDREVVVAVAGSAPQTEVLILLRPGVAVSGHVRDAAGELVTGATLLAVEERVRDGAPALGALARTSTDDRGRYELHVPAGRKWRMSAHARGHARVEESLSVPVDGATTWDVELPGASTITGRVLDDTGAAVAGARILVSVSASSDSSVPRDARRGATALAWSAADGTFRVEDVPEGKLDVVHVRAADFADTVDAPRDPAERQAVSAESPLFLTVRMDRGATAEGLVGDGEGGRAEAAEVVLEDGWRFLAGALGTRSLEDGTFTLPCVPTDRPFALVARAEGRPPEAGQRLALEARPGETVRVELQLAPRDVATSAAREVGSLAGRVHDVGGSPVARALVLVGAGRVPTEVRRLVPSALARVRTDAEGRFRAGGLPEGEVLYAVVLAAPGHRAHVDEDGAAVREGLRVGDQLVEFQLDRQF